MTRDDLHEAMTNAVADLDWPKVDSADVVAACVEQVRVKPLEWDERNPDRYWKAEAFGMVYDVSASYREAGKWVATASPRWSSERDELREIDREEAFAWCEDHNRDRILSALVEG